LYRDKETAWILEDDGSVESPLVRGRKKKTSRRRIRSKLGAAPTPSSAEKGDSLLEFAGREAGERKKVSATLRAKAERGLYQIHWKIASQPDEASERKGVRKEQE